MDKFFQSDAKDQIAVCDVRGTVRYSKWSDADADIVPYFPSIANLPKVCIQSEEALNRMHHTDSFNSEDVFVPANSNHWQLIKNIWHEKGIIAALKASLQKPLSYFRIFRMFAEMLQTIEKKFQDCLYYQAKRKMKLGEYAECRNWKDGGNVRSVSWHPHQAKYLVVTTNDTVHLYSADSCMPVLKHKLQTDITVAKFRPWCACEVAVGCAQGIYLWVLDPNSVTTFPSLSCATLLTQQKHVTSMSWNCRGDLLASCSIYDHSVYLWDVCMEYGVPLRKFGGGTVTLVDWSPDFRYLFSATTGIVFRVWKTGEWSNEKWFVPCGHIKTACWSPCGTVLVYATSADCFLYAINISLSSPFVSGEKWKQTRSIRIADLTKCEVKSGTTIGGEVSSIKWNPSGKFLAVMFKETNAVAVFYIFLSSPIRLIPRCLIEGRPSEYPQAISFQENCDFGANLLIVWSSGRVQYFPFSSNENGPSFTSR